MQRSACSKPRGSPACSQKNVTANSVYRDRELEIAATVWYNNQVKYLYWTIGDLPVEFVPIVHYALAAVPHVSCCSQCLSQCFA